MAHIGYLRVSTLDQKTARQLDGIKLDKIFEEYISGIELNRPVLEECLRYLRDGDTLHVDSIDRLVRNTITLETLLKDLTCRGIIVHFHTENLLFTGDDSSIQMLLFRMMSAFAQFERANIKERQRVGIAKAKAAGQHLGRPAKITPKDRQIILDKLQEGIPIAVLAEQFNISTSLIYKMRNRYG